VWRSIVKSLGFTPDSAMSDSAAKAAVQKPDSTAGKKP
jgi:hypothetical protein